MAAPSPSRRRRFPSFAALLGVLAIVTLHFAIRSRTRCDRLSIANMGFFLDEGIAGFAVYFQPNTVNFYNDGTMFNSDNIQKGHRAWSHAPEWHWLWWKWGPDEVSRFTVMLPAWPIPLFFTAASTLLFARWLSRTRAGRCLVCGYDFHTLPPVLPCPECGQPRLKTPPAPLS